MKRFAVLTILTVLTICSFALGQDQTPRTGRRQAGAHRLKSLDVDQDGRISRDEWKRTPEIFDRLDANHDGAVTRDEFQAARGKRGERGQRAMRRLREADKNNDGQISRDEWPGKAERFDRLDTNHDGVITRDEVRARRGRRQGTGDSTTPRRPPDGV